jgi:hypothetical protein
MKKTIFALLLSVILFACAKEKETDLNITVSRDATTEQYTFDLSALTLTNTDFDLKIFSKSGSPIFSTSFTGTKYSWDGKTSDGNAVADGMYTYIIKNKDKSLNQDGFFYVLSKK